MFIRPLIPRHPESARRGPQRGLVTLLFLLILLSAGSYFLLRALNQASLGQATAERTTQRALSTAREALLGYAVRYPDNPETKDFDAGPGYLPCPDTQADDNPGQADAPCAKGSNTTVGLFPWHTLDVPEARDSSGARLWYVVSESHRNNPKQPLNSEHRGTLGLDQCVAEGDDIVALIIAPGAALKGQARAESPYPTTGFIDDYLEGQNASLNNDCYSTQNDDTHNDQILAITRQDLMAVVETRVLDDIANALSRYKAAHDRYPWLSAFTNPSNNKFRGQPTNRHGLLPLRQIEQNTTAKPSNPYALDNNAFAFDAPFTLSWSIPTGGTVTSSGSAAPKEDCLRSTSLSCPLPMQGDVLGTASGEWTKAGLCKVQSGHKLSCRAVREAANPADGTLRRRTYTVVLTNWTYTIDPPTADSTRRQSFALLTSALGAGMEAEIELKDEQVGVSGSESSSVLKLPAGTLVNSFELKGVPFDLEIDDDDKIDLPGHPSPGELPGWLVASKWHHLLYVAFRTADAPGSGVVATCTSTSTDCLTVNRSRSGAAPVPIKVGAVVLGAGAALSAQVRPGNALGDYFEGANAEQDNTFEKADAAATFNDRLRLLGVDEDK